MDPSKVSAQTKPSIERVSPLDGYLIAGVYPSPSTLQDTIDLQIVEKRNLVLQQLACWPDTLTDFERSVREQLSMSPVSVSKAGIHVDQAMFRIEPTKWWLIGGKTLELPVSVGTSVELSHAWTLLDIRGRLAPDLLNRHISLDLREQSCPVGRFQSTGLHHVGVKLWRHTAGYGLFLPRGFALSMFQLLCESAGQFGYQLSVEEGHPSGDTV